MKKKKNKSLKEVNKENLKEKEKAITLIALVITIIILLVLAGVSIIAMTKGNGLFTRAKEAKEKTEKSQIIENIKSDILGVQSENEGKISENKLIEVLEKQGTVDYEEDGITIKGITTSKYEISIKEIWDGTTEDIEETVIADGSWDKKAKVNTPKIKNTGLIAIYYDKNGNEVELTDQSSKEEWSKWYDYSSDKKQWANAITKDENGNITGYFVWIPRYEYSINGKTVNIKFIPTKKTTVDTSEGYTYIHPAFTNNIQNGGWDKDISGFWIAKYPAGYQKNTITINNGKLSTTIQNSGDTLVNSGKKYTNTNKFTRNPLGSISTTTDMSYPVFKPLTYAYNNITISDSYTLSREIQSATNFYGLNNIDSHMVKNSEWGAVAYLTQSSYGRSGTELNINNYYTSTSSPYKTVLTGVYANGTSTSATTSTTSVYAYNTSIGLKGSSTGNITGIYDLNGCAWERTSGLISNGNSSLATYGVSILNETGITYSGTKVTAKTGNSTKYVTIYPYNSSSDSYTNNWTAYKKTQTSTYGYGDSILETSTSGNISTSWNSDYSLFPYGSGPFFIRGGGYDNTTGAGMFSFDYSDGVQFYNNGFRAVLISE